MYSPLIHFVPVETLITLASLTSVPEKQKRNHPSQSRDLCLSVLLESDLRSQRPDSHVNRLLGSPSDPSYHLLLHGQTQALALEPSGMLAFLII